MISRIFEGLLIVLIVLACLYQIAALCSVLSFFKRKAGSPSQAIGDIPVSILKPLKGTDPEFIENLGSFCDQEHSRFEVLLGFVGTPSGVPDLDTALSKSICRVTHTNIVLGPNEKVSNLEGLLNHAQHEFLAISDSDTRVGPDYLSCILSEYLASENTGLVTCLYKISEPKSIGVAFESLAIATDFIPSVLVARAREGVTFGLGASLFVSRRVLAEIGGLADIAHYLADDYQVGNRIAKKGYRVVLSRYVMEIAAGSPNVRDSWMRQLRWARTFRTSRPAGYLGYGMVHGTAWSLLLMAFQGTTPLAVGLLSAVLLLRTAAAVTVWAKVIKKRKWLVLIPFIPLKDLLSFALWAWSFAGNTVQWRGVKFEIRKGGTIQKMGAGRKSSCPLPE